MGRAPQRGHYVVRAELGMVRGMGMLTGEPPAMCRRNPEAALGTLG